MHRYNLHCCLAVAVTGPSYLNYVYELTSLSLISPFNKGIASWMKTVKSGIGTTPN
jgi:hypothetical protein